MNYAILFFEYTNADTFYPYIEAKCNIMRHFLRQKNGTPERIPLTDGLIYAAAASS